MSRDRPVLLFQLGEAPEPVRAVHGPFASWYERAWGDELAVHDGRAGGAAPDPRDFAGVLVSGSAASLTRREPWMDVAIGFVRRAFDVGVPVLGVCFGHQVLGAAFGHEVVENPVGWEIGTTTVAVEADDPLLEGLGPTLRVNMVHQDVVTGDSPWVRRLGRSPRSELAMLAVGDSIRGVQFHPEVTGPIVKGYIHARRGLLTDLDPDHLLAMAGDTPDGIAIMRNFRSNFVEKS